MPSAATTPLTATLQCFKPGSHVAMSGARLTFAQSDLAATAGAYDPALHEAPLVIGHPELDAPAYGLVRSLAFAGGALEATPAEVNPEFAALVNAGSFSKMSAAFWGPAAPGNPVPGVYYLRHIGFLGATAPAVKGLRRPAFAGTDEGVVEFSEWDDVDNASLWRAVRDWVLGKWGQAEADLAVPPHLVASVERGAQAGLNEAAAEIVSTAEAAALPGFAQPAASKEPAVTEEQAQALQAENTRLAADRDRLTAQLAAQADAERQTRFAAAHGANVAFASGLVAARRLPVAAAPLVAELFDHFARQAETAPVEFGEGTARAPLAPALRALFETLPELVAFGDVATGARAAGGDAALDPNDAQSIAFAAQRHQDAERANGRDVGIAQAVQHVLRPGAAR